MPDLIEYIKQYVSLLDRIHQNREISNRALNENKNLRKELEVVKNNLRRWIYAEKADGRSLYQICQEAFGGNYKKFKPYFQMLYALVEKPSKKPND